MIVFKEFNNAPKMKTVKKAMKRCDKVSAR
jgi:hypothetical protein